MIADKAAFAAKWIPNPEGTGFRSKLRVNQVAMLVLISVVKNCSTIRPIRNGSDSRDSIMIHNEAFSLTQNAIWSTMT